SKSRDGGVPQIPLAQGPVPETPESQVALVKGSIEALRSGGASKATGVAAAITDPAARQLVEWLILRSDHNGRPSAPYLDLTGAPTARYLDSIAANPNWPSLQGFRRRAEAMLWVENKLSLAQALSFFNDSPPQTGSGHMVLARALAAQGDSDGASTHVREAWR